MCAEKTTLQRKVSDSSSSVLTNTTSSSTSRLVASSKNKEEGKRGTTKKMRNMHRPSGKCVELRLEQDGVVVRRFPSYVQASEEFKVDRNTIRRWCRSNVKQQGFWWSQKAERWQRPVEKLDMETGEILGRYDSVTEVSREIGALQESIFECLAGRRKSCCGYFWRYEGSEKLPPELLCKKRPVEQLHLYTGQVLARHESVTKAAKSVGAFREGVRACLSGRANSCKGFFWRYVGSDEVPLVQKIKEEIMINGGSTSFIGNEESSTSPSEEKSTGTGSSSAGTAHATLSTHNTNYTLSSNTAVSKNKHPFDVLYSNPEEQEQARLGPPKKLCLQQAGDQLLDKQIEISSTSNRNDVFQHYSFHNHSTAPLLLGRERPYSSTTNEDQQQVENLLPLVSRPFSVLSSPRMANNNDNSSSKEQEMQQDRSYSDGTSIGAKQNDINMKEMLVGERLRLLRKRDGQWCEGTIVSYDIALEQHLIRLDMGKRVRVRLDRLLIEWG